MARKQYRGWVSHDESFLFPPSPRDWLDEGHLVYFILDVVELLDLSAIEEVIEAKDARGERPYNPAMMVALLVYAYSVGIFSSRKIARATHEQVAFRVLTGGQHPHFSRINAFRKTHLVAFAGLFKQVLRLCQEAGLVKLGHVALDGSKVQANASKHKAMSYGYMVKLEAKLETEISALLARAAEADAADDARLGAENDDVDIPAELRRRGDRLAKLREAKAGLEAEAKAARAQHELDLAAGCDERAEAAEADKDRKLNETLAAKHREAADRLSDDDDPPFVTPEGLPKHRPKSTPDGTPNDKAQRNLTDPDSRIMPSGGAFLQGYNAQAVADDAYQVIVAAALTNQSPDAGNLAPMLELAVRNLGAAPTALTADTGYWTPQVEEISRKLGTEAYVALKRTKHNEGVSPFSGEAPPAGADARTRMAHKLTAPAGRAIYALRKSTVEPVFGQMKEVRGFRRFSLRGIAAAAAEWDLVCLTHNLIKLFRYGGRPLAAE